MKIHTLELFDANQETQEAEIFVSIFYAFHKFVHTRKIAFQVSLVQISMRIQSMRIHTIEFLHSIQKE